MERLPSLERSEISDFLKGNWNRLGTVAEYKSQLIPGTIHLFDCGTKCVPQFIHAFNWINGFDKKKLKNSSDSDVLFFITFVFLYYLQSETKKL